jgi:hypothetical protein
MKRTLPSIAVGVSFACVSAILAPSAQAASGGLAGAWTSVDTDGSNHGTLVCLPGGNVFRSRLAIGFGYDAGTDTLTDSFGIVWHRAR